MTFTRAAGLAMAVAALGSLVGCASPPPGKSRGRVSPGETTDAEIGSGQMYIADLNDASDRIAEALMKDLVEELQHSELKGPDGQSYESTLVYGDIANKASRMPTSDYEVVRERIRDTLIGSREFKRHFRVIENYARWDQLKNREIGNTNDPLQRGGKNTGRNVNPDYTYFLNGNAFSIDRGTTKAFYLNFQLMRASDSEIVFSKKYEQTYK
jgi:PBP1b-binding outer membrane lipoprotein LpoB